MSRASDRQPLKTLAGRLEAVPAFGCPSGGTERSVLNSFLKHWVSGYSVSIHFLAAMENFSRIVPNRMGMMLPTGWESCSQPLGLLFPTVGNSSH